MCLSGVRAVLPGHDVQAASGVRAVLPGHDVPARGESCTTRP